MKFILPAITVVLLGAAALLVSVVAAESSPTWEVRLEKPRHSKVEARVFVGRVEVKRTNETEWGTVCGPITKTTATVLCASAGYPIDHVTIVPSFPDGQGLIRMSKMSCPVGAQGFSDCEWLESSPEEKNNRCTHYDDVGVGCFNSDLGWTTEFQNAQFDLTHRTGHNDDMAFDIQTMLDIESGTGSDILVSKVSDSVQTADPRWSQYIFRFENTTKDANGDPHVMGPYVAWMAAATFHQISDSFLYRKYKIYNAQSSIETPLEVSTVSENPSFWEWRLVEKDPFQPGSFTGVYNDQIRTGRVEVRPGPNAQWGSVCGGGLGLEAAAAICNTIASQPVSGGSSDLRTPWTVLPIYFYGGGDGPIWLNTVSCQDSSPLTFGNSCPRYTLSKPEDRGNNSCDHTLDIGLNCQADITTSPYDFSFTAFVRTADILAQHVYPDAASFLQSQICDYFGVPRYRWISTAPVVNDTVNGYYKVEFQFVEPDVSALHLATAAALSQAMQLIRSEGLQELFFVDQLLVQMEIKPTTTTAPTNHQEEVTSAPPTPQPNYGTAASDAPYIFGVDCPSLWTRDTLFQKLAAWCDSKVFMFVGEREYTILVPGGSEVAMKRVEFFVRGQPVSAVASTELNTLINTELLNNATAWTELGVQQVVRMDLLDSDSGDGTQAHSVPEHHSSGNTIFFIICIILVVCFFGFLLHHRSKMMARDAALYQHVGRHGLTEGEGASDEAMADVGIASRSRERRQVQESGDVVETGRQHHHTTSSDIDSDTVGLRADEGEVVLQGRAVVDIQDAVPNPSAVTVDPEHVA